MTSFNQVVLLGYLGKDPEALKATEKGSFVRLSLATSKKYKNAKGEWQEETQWHTVYVRNKQGDVVLEYLKKGSRLHIFGELRTNKWTLNAHQN